MIVLFNKSNIIVDVDKIEAVVNEEWDKNEIVDINFYIYKGVNLEKFSLLEDFCTHKLNVSHIWDDCKFYITNNEPIVLNV